MRRKVAVAAVVSGAFAAAAGPAAAAPYVVTLRDEVANVTTTVDSLQRSVAFTSKLRYSSALKGFSADLSSGQVTKLRANPDVAAVADDVAVMATGASAPVLAGDAVPPGIRRVGAATTTTAHDASGTAVAVLDTGADLANADLNVVTGTNCIKAGTAAADDNGHGTNVAGILAARDNGKGVVGVAPGTKLYAVKVLNNKATGTLSQLLCGINWVAANAGALGIRVANMSIAGTGTNDNNCGRTNNDAEHKAICAATAAGVTFVAGAGNNAKSFASTIPAAYPEVLTVTAMTDTDGLPGGLGPVASCRKGEKDDTLASFSNYPGTSTDAAHALAAPGTCVVSDKPGGGTSVYYGTSQASPHVAGAVALCLDDAGLAGPCAGLSVADVIQRVRADAAAAGTPANGFVGDPLRPVGTKSLGWLVRAGGY